LQQGKQLANNRLVTAMQEKGATQRAGIAAGAQLGTQQMRGEQAAQQTASEVAMSDRRGAEAERAHREELTLKKVEQEATAKYRETTLALDQQQLDELVNNNTWNKTRQEELDARTSLQKARELAQGERFTNGMLSLLETKQNNESVLEKANTTITQKKTEYEESLKVYDYQVEHAAKIIKINPSMSLEPGFVGVTRTGITSTPVGEPLSEQEDVANPLSAFQAAVTGTQSKITLEMLAPAGKGLPIEKNLSDGTLDQTDITSFMAAKSAMQETLSEKINAAKSDKEANLWRKYDLQIDMLVRTLERQKDSTTPVKGSPNLTVGMLVRTGMAPADSRYSPDFSAQMYRAFKETGGNIDATRKKYTKSYDPIFLWPINEDDSPATIKAKTEDNDALRLAFPDKFSAEADLATTKENYYKGLNQ